MPFLVGDHTGSTVTANSGPDTTTVLGFAVEDVVEKEEVAVFWFIRVQRNHRTLDDRDSSLSSDSDEILVDPVEGCLSPDLLLYGFHREGVGSLEVFIPVPESTVHFSALASCQQSHFGAGGISREAGFSLDPRGRGEKGLEVVVHAADVLLKASRKIPLELFADSFQELDQCL